MLVELLLVKNAILAIDRDHLSPETLRLHLLLKCCAMSWHTAAIRSGALRSTAIFAEDFESSSFGGQAGGQFFECLINGFLIHVEIDQPGFEVKLLSGPIADRVFEPATAHVAALVFLSPEGEEGVLVGPVDRRAGQAEEERVRQCHPHLPTEVAFLAAMGFVDQHDDVVAGVEHTFHVTKLVDGGDDDLAGVLAQGLLVLAALGLDEVGRVVGVEGAADLAVEIDPVDQDHHRRVLEGRVQTQLAGGEEHQQ